MLRTHAYFFGRQSLPVRLLALMLIFSCLTIFAPSAFATEATTLNEHNGCLFLKANVPEDFNHVVCVTLKDTATEKNLTLKVEGGSVFEVYIKLPDGDYEVESAYVENKDQYTVTFDVNQITVRADTCPSIVLDVEQKESTATPTASPSESSDNGVTAESIAISEDPILDNAKTINSSDDVDESVTTELLDQESREEGIENTQSNSTKETVSDICLSILTAVIFFAIIVLIVSVVRNKMESSGS